MKLNKLNASTRRELNPFNQHYVLCKELCLIGCFMKIGWKVPVGIDPMVLLQHYNNGVIGTKDELESLEGVPVELSHANDVLAPRARWVTQCDQVEKEVKIIEEAGGPEISMENASLLKTKGDLVNYAALFGIKLKVATNINMAKMRVSLEKTAIKMGLLQLAI